MEATHVIVFLLFLLSSYAEEFPGVESSVGRVRGYYQSSYEGRTISAFEGIPYAKPPLEDLRFEEPQEIGAWEGVLEANKTYICPQLITIANQSFITGDEDCLYVNVYSPRRQPSSDDNLDVVAFIHGGAFIVGSPTYNTGPNLLLDRDLILVTFNYRLGILGFLSTEDEVVPGNIGLKDQVFALKWVQRNIKSFGGNPNSVTLDGVSAGAACVHYHYVSPLSKGLFHRGFSHSGTVINSWSVQTAPLERAQRSAALVGCVADNSTKDLIKCLKQKPVNQLIESTSISSLGNSTVATFGPTIEVATAGAFLDDDPYKLLSAGKINDVPWINSYCTADGSVSGKTLLDYLDIIEEQWYTVAVEILACNYTLSIEDRNETFKKIKHFYFGNESISMETADTFIKLLTDRHFKLAAIKASQIQSKVGNSSVYSMQYGYVGNNTNTGLNSTFGAGHGDDMMYLYGIYDSNTLSDSDERIKNFWLDLFASYAATGVPNVTGVNWEPTNSSTERFTYLELTSPETILLRNDSNFLQAMEFWDSLPLQENK